MNPDNQGSSCSFPNFFSNTFAPAVERRLPEPGSLASVALDHTTKLPTFVDTVSRDLCDDGRMSAQSRDAALGFISRSSTAALVTGGAATLAALGVATAGAPLAAVGLGIVGLAILPPLAEWAVHRVGSFFGELFAGVEKPQDS